MKLITAFIAIISIIGLISAVGLPEELWGEWTAFADIASVTYGAGLQGLTISCKAACSTPNRVPASITIREKTITVTTSANSTIANCPTPAMKLEGPYSVATGTTLNGNVTLTLNGNVVPLGPRCISINLVALTMRFDMVTTECPNLQAASGCAYNATESLSAQNLFIDGAIVEKQTSDASGKMISFMAAFVALIAYLLL